MLDSQRSRMHVRLPACFHGSITGVPLGGARTAIHSCLSTNQCDRPWTRQILQLHITVLMPRPPFQQALHELLLAERDSRHSSLEEDLALAASPTAGVDLLMSVQNNEPSNAALHRLLIRFKHNTR